MKKRKYMIRCDIEGVTGVTTYEQAEGSEFGKMMLANDLRAVIKGLVEPNPCEIVIYDEHTDGRNVILEDMPECVSVICGKPPYRPNWGGIDSSYDAMLMVGFHAKSQTQKALLPHSYRLENIDITINGTSVGEIGIEAAVAGDFDVPTILITGDSAGMTEAASIIPDVHTVVVKEAMGEFSAKCYSPRYTSRLLYEAAKKIASTPITIKPFKFEGPVELNIEIAVSEYLNWARARHSEFFVADNIIAISGKTVTEAWSKYFSIQFGMNN